jgi:hypothetical protein
MSFKIQTVEIRLISLENRISKADAITEVSKEMRLIDKCLENFLCPSFGQIV